MIRQKLIAWLKNVSCWRSHKAPAISPESTGRVSARQPLGKGDHGAGSYAGISTVLLMLR